MDMHVYEQLMSRVEQDSAELKRLRQQPVDELGF